MYIYILYTILITYGQLFWASILWVINIFITWQGNVFLGRSKFSFSSRHQVPWDLAKLLVACNRRRHIQLVSPMFFVQQNHLLSINKKIEKKMVWPQIMANVLKKNVQLYGVISKHCVDKSNSICVSNNSSTVVFVQPIALLQEEIRRCYVLQQQQIAWNAKKQSWKVTLEVLSLSFSSLSP